MALKSSKPAVKKAEEQKTPGQEVAQVPTVTADQLAALTAAEQATEAEAKLAADAEAQPTAEQVAETEAIAAGLVADAQAKKETKAAKKSSGTMVMVENLRPSYFQQPSTGIRIQAKSVREMKDDSWLDMQVKANLLKRV